MGILKKSLGITGKLTTITVLMFLLFFIIVIFSQIVISGYLLINRTEENLPDKLVRIDEIMTDMELSNVDDYSYEHKSLLSYLRKIISDDYAVSEFVIVENDTGEIACALRNEIVIYTFRDKEYKFARFENVSVAELSEAVDALKEDIRGLTVMPDVSIWGERIEESNKNRTYFAIDSYKIAMKDDMYFNEEEKAYAKNSEVMLTELIGKYYNEFITGKNTYPSYTENVNRNRIALIDAVTKGEYEDKKEISETYFYRTIRINEDYSLVMRTQLIPVSAVLDNSQGTYIILILIAALFSLILSIVFSRMVVKPVRRIENKAKKLANLDFSEGKEYKKEYNYERKDEIGSLYRSINTLAINLNRAITELKDKNEQLMSDIEKKEELDISRREFIAATSHELKTPLARIRGYAEALNMNLSEDKKGYYCTSLMKEVDAMNGLILEMISLSKLEAQSYNDLDMGDIDLYTVTKELIERSMKLAEDKSIKINLISDKDVLCRGDAAKIDRVITNFIDNAIHYTPGGGNIEIRIKNEGEKVKFEIENEGSHVDEKDINYIWDSFYKADKSRTRDEKKVTAERTGLGLSIIKVILNLHRSDFGVKNTEKGVIFYFDLDKKDSL